MDAVTYLSSAIETYQALDREGQKQLLGEVAAVGQKGLAINDPDQMHQLRLYLGVARFLPCRWPAFSKRAYSSCCQGKTRGST
jgi:hypothetical protein